MSFSGKNSSTESKNIENQPFWPALDLAVLIDDYRTPGDLPQTSVERQLMFAMVVVNSRLEAYRAEQQAAGYETLEDVPAETVGGISIQMELYTRAVFCTAKASILRDWPSIDRRSEAENQARTSEETEDRYLEFADQAICQFTGRTFVNVEAL